LVNIYSDKIEDFSKFLWEAGKNVNLFGFSSYENMIEIGIKDSINSIIIAKRFLKGTGHILDIGSGGGLPGIIAAIMMENTQCILVEARKKKANFLNSAIAHLGLKNCIVENIRIEEYKNKNAFDLVFCRAVGNLALSLEYALPFLKKKGIFIANKGKNIEKELKDAEYAMQLLGGKIIERVKLETGENVIITKFKNTPEKFPRNTGIPSKYPLIK